MCFRLTPRSTTLDDPELLSSNSLGIWRDFADLEATAAKRMETDPLLSATELLPTVSTKCTFQ